MNYAPLGPIPSIGSRGFAVFGERQSHTTARISLIFRDDWPSQGAAEQQNNGEKTAA
jgi:hypothetical protein